MDEHEGDGEHQHEDEERREAGAIANHLPKRARRNKGLVVVFDPAARKSFVTGFHKRKKKRRKIAEHQKQVKDRQKRLEDRKERRHALRLAIGESKSEGDEGDGDNGREHDLNEMERSQAPTATVVYEDGDVTTIIKTCSIDMNADFHSQLKTNQGLDKVSPSTGILSPKKKKLQKRHPPNTTSRPKK